MKIASYVQMNRLINPTGVGKHIINVLPAIAGRPGLELSLMTSRQYLGPDGKLPATNPLSGLPVAGIPLPQKALDILWLGAGAPSADRWAGGADWIYCPVETPVPSRHARLAVTCHCLNMLEADLPWSAAADTRTNRRWWRRRMDAIRRKAEIVFVVSEFLRDRTAALAGISPNRMVVVGNGAEKDYFAVAETPRRPVHRPYLIAVGGLTARKGAPLILGTARALLERRSEIEVWVAGKSEPNYAAEAKALPNLRQLGYKGLDELPRLVRDAVALIFPSRYDTFGIPAVESMAAGTPPIVSHWAGLPEVVGDGGIVLNNGSGGGEIADIVVDLATNGRLRAEVAARGRQRAKRFTWEACADRIVDALKRP